LGATLAPYASQAMSLMSGDASARNQMIITSLALGSIGLIILIFNKYMTV
jgi:hypothetical protein